MAKKKKADTARPARKRGAQPDNLNALKAGFYSRSFTDDELIAIGQLAVADLTLDEEIGMLRVVMRRVLDARLRPAKTVELMGRATGQVRRLIESRDRLAGAGETQSAIAAATARALDELAEELGVDL